jgi:ABC-type transport system involved in cytochrome c biogenesis permease subunit
MSVKWTPQGLLIYATMAAFLLAVILLKTERKALGRGFWFSGFVFATAAVIFRGIHTGHTPMQNLFEFFLCMAAFLWPLAQISRYQTGSDTDFQDALLGLVILVPAGFVFNEDPRMLPPALQSPLFIPHVGCYVAAYIILARSAFMAIPLFSCAGPLTESHPRFMELSRADAVSRQTAAMGFVLMTVGLFLGSLWGKICWGHYWQWDPKEMWSLATWFMYAAYFHLRLRNGIRTPRLLAILLWLGFLFVVLTLTWINVSRLFSGMHTYA